MLSTPTKPDERPPSEAAPRPSAGEVFGPSSAWRRLGDSSLTWLARCSGAMILVLAAALIGVLGFKAIPAIKTFGVSFLVSTEWRANTLERPKLDASGDPVMVDGETVNETIPPTFGALPVMFGTAASATIALLIAVPLSFGASLFIVRVAPRFKVAAPLSFLIEFLAAIPSLAYGIWGLFVVAPLLGRNLLCGSTILAIMILPIITAVSRDVLATVPRAQIEGSLALGATWWQSCWGMLRYGRSGLFGAVMLGLARAAGETMAVAMVIGNNNQIKASLFAPAQTMASLLANEFAEASEEIHRSALLYVALILLAMSLLFNVVARWLVVGRQSRTAMSA